MATNFEYTFSCIDMTVDVLFDYSIDQNWLDENHYETRVDGVKIIRIMCGEWDVTHLILEHAPAKVDTELENACFEYAANNH
jgi:hypothetical protein